MRNFTRLFVLLPGGEAGEYERLGESNSTFPLLWKALLVEGRTAAPGERAVLAGVAQDIVVADAHGALGRARRLADAVLACGMAEDVRHLDRYLHAALQHLQQVVTSWTFADEQAPVFAVALDDIVRPTAASDGHFVAAQLRRWSSQWRHIVGATGASQYDALRSVLLDEAVSRRDLRAWRTWAELFGLALLDHGFFAQSFRAPLAREFVAREAEPVTRGHYPRGTFDESWPFVHGRAVVLVGERFGYVDEAGAYVVPPSFDAADDFTAAGVARVRRGRAFGLLARDGSFVAPLQYEQMHWSAPLDGWMAQCAGKCVLLNADGTPRLDAGYEAIEPLGTQGLLRVRTAGRWGLATASGHALLPCEFEELRLLCAIGPTAKAVLSVTRDGRSGVIDVDGEVLAPLEFSRVEALESHAGVTQECRAPQLVRVTSMPGSRRPRAGIWDLAARRCVVGCEYDWIWLTLLARPGEYGFIVATKHPPAKHAELGVYRVGVLSAKGAVLIPHEYAWLGANAAPNSARHLAALRSAIHDEWAQGRPIAACRRPRQPLVWLDPPAAGEPDASTSVTVATGVSATLAPPPCPS